MSQVSIKPQLQLQVQQAITRPSDICHKNFM